jgi:hypothetical protein
LPPFLRVVVANVTGVPATLARHEIHALAPPKRVNPAAIVEARSTLADVSPRFPPGGSIPVLSEREVVNGLLRCLSERPRRAPIACLARAAGLSRMTLYRVMRSSSASKATCAALTPILIELAGGTFGFQRRARRWEGIEYPPLPAPVEEPKGGAWVHLPCNPSAQSLEWKY